MVEIYRYGTSKDLVSEKDEIKCSNIIKRYKKLLTLMMLQKSIKEHNPNWPQLPDHPYTVLIIGVETKSVSRKTNSLFNLINRQPDIGKIYFYVKNLNEAKYHFLIKKREDVGTKHFNVSKAFIEYSNDMDIYKKLSNMIQIRNVKY